MAVKLPEPKLPPGWYRDASGNYRNQIGLLMVGCDCINADKLRSVAAHLAWVMNDEPVHASDVNPPKAAYMYPAIKPGKPKCTFV